MEGKSTQIWGIGSETITVNVSRGNIRMEQHKMINIFKKSSNRGYSNLPFWYTPHLWNPVLQDTWSVQYFFGQTPKPTPSKKHSWKHSTCQVAIPLLAASHPLPGYSYQQHSHDTPDPRHSHPAVPELVLRSPEEDPAKVLRGLGRGICWVNLKVPKWDHRFGIIFKCSNHPAKGQESWTTMCRDP